MNDVLSFYQKQAQVRRSSFPALAQVQSAALAKFMKLGFPTRRDEAWKYSPPDLFLQGRFRVPTVLEHRAPSDLQHQRTGQAPLIRPSGTFSPCPGRRERIEAFWGQQLFVENGEVIGKEMLQVPTSVFIGSFEEALASHPALLEPYLNRLSDAEHGFHALNTAMLQTSLLIYVPKDQSLSAPLTLSHWQDQANQAVYSRFLVILEAGASLTLIEDYAGEAACAYLTNSLTEVFLHEQAKLTHVQIQRESQAAMHVSNVFTYQSAASTYHSHVINVGGKWVRCDKSVNLQGEKASCLLNGVYGLTQKQHVDQHTTITHAIGECESTQDYKGILTGPSRAVFNGRVVVAKDAQHSKAMQQNKNLLLSHDAEVDTKPQLEIYANDVMCSHGATVGQISEEAMFYFLSRGIAREEAMRFLMDAFTETNLARIEDQACRAWISSLLHAHLQGGRDVEH
jgi:Fe-S cluster assembly protein SufD